MNNIMAAVISLFILTKPSMAVVPEAVNLGRVDYSLSNRYNNTFVNDVFSDNILLTLAYMRGSVSSGKPIVWDQVRSDFSYSLVLKPGETFAFHDRVLPEYANQTIKTTNSHFNSTQGFRSDGYLVGDGVCHLASFINVVARQANLEVKSPTRHDFAKIPDVTKEQGVSIYYDPNALGSSQMQNLYITNNQISTIAFVFSYANKTLDIQVEKI